MFDIFSLLRSRLCILGENTTAMMVCPFECFTQGFILSVRFVDNININHLIKEVSVGLLYCKGLVFSRYFVISKYFVERYLRLWKCKFRIIYSF